MRFGADVRWSPGGTVQGEIAVESSPPVPFYGVIQLVGLLEAQLGPRPQVPAGSDLEEMSRWCAF